MIARRTGLAWRFALTVSFLASGAASVRPGTAVAIELQDIPLPDDARLQIIGRDIVQNGQSVSIASFTSGNTVEGILAWYRDLWPPLEDSPGHVEAELGGWQMISRLQDRFSIALQLQPAQSGGARGLLSVLDLEAPGIVLDAPPMPDGAKLLSDTLTRDGARQARTVLLETSGRTGMVAAFYRDRMRRDGWQVTADDGDASPAVLLFAGPDGRAELTVNDAWDGTAFVVLNVVTGTQ